MFGQTNRSAYISQRKPITTIDPIINTLNSVQTNKNYESNNNLPPSSKPIVFPWKHINFPMLKANKKKLKMVQLCARGQNFSSKQFHKIVAHFKYPLIAKMKQKKILKLSHIFFGLKQTGIGKLKRRVSHAIDRIVNVFLFFLCWKENKPILKKAYKISTLEHSMNIKAVK